MTQPFLQTRIDSCESEPIHIPGAIQPFGMLLSIELPSLRIANASMNCHPAFGLSAEALVKTSLAEHVDALEVQALRCYLTGGDLQEAAPLTVSILHAATGSASQWGLSAHERQGLLIIELEPLAPDAADVRPFQRLIRNAVQALLGAVNLQALCDEAVLQVRNMTGYDRVMVYRFTEDWHGDVIAEAKAPEMHSYLHHHFPASDIPAQARAIFFDNWLRIIPDVEYAPVPIYPGLNPATGMPIDLGRALLRSVSPLHIEYLRNMEVGATLTLPLIDDGKLWGLVACHHATPRPLSEESRLGAKMVAQLVSSQLGLKEALADARYGAQLKRVHQNLLARMEQEDDLVQSLVTQSPTMLDLAGATGAAAAIYFNNEWTLVGTTPSVAQIETLVDWLASQHGKQEVFCTNRLGEMFAPAQAYRHIASGLLAVAIPKSERNYILWFRPEVITTVVWAGAPEKRLPQDGTGRLHPRLSFDSWKEVVEGQATPWKKVEIDAVTELRASILAIDLRRAFHKEQAARAVAERVSQEKENMVHMVSHDIRNPLGVIQMTWDMLQQESAASPAVRTQLIARGIRATDSMERLVTSILDLARQQRTSVPAPTHAERAQALVQEAVELAQPLAERAGLSLTAAYESAPLLVSCQRARVEQVLGNLISNALKFTPAGGAVTVAVQRQAGETVFTVTDTGIGIPADLLPRVFDRLVQGPVNTHLGIGLGLSIVKGIVEQEGGRVWVDSTAGSGTTFSFTLPTAA
ncbi:light-regulated signal transduction histidine kinase (bacteriophytochrome) [Pseudoduganella lurida]|uniref:histidine kinase n=1 Tax=Pseudoduganella lurida TaxID=1036180 RepID=A0A562RJN6_9BURK|nr:ATP-binding protein [Pseudoduganella lurida]TWI69275.1 light-regulated signal transduction histidine kinase (bacteriophytochrome) [Pseudoduganella lurida]